MQVHSIGGKLSLEVFIRGPRSWTPKMFRLVVLWVWIIAAVVTALDEREFDPQVAPPQSLVPKPFQLWRSFTSQVRLVLSRFQPKPPTPPTIKTRMGITTTTTEPELQFYGALNPIYQTGNF
ncbi:uncharacterized protein LOC108106294 isoform X1 [Drosophila eugracilis]|uniref:uncharacterized protein LOC108106294 isoform X1 n=1 Tax=Drosophila eugracilis TaxID=29029 RepID=UPI0007E6D633|nr:uncharacterized protein LOC108106294 isoform X1 [Drosophila eugracilis]